MPKSVFYLEVERLRRAGPPPRPVCPECGWELAIPGVPPHVTQEMIFETTLEVLELHLSGDLDDDNGDEIPF